MLRLRRVALGTLAFALAVSLPTSIATATAARTPVFFGIDVPGDQQTLIDRAAAAAGARPTVDNIFVKLDSGFSTATLTGISARRMTPMVSLEPWSWKSTWGQSGLPQYSLAAIASGRWDQQFLAIARTTAAYRGPVYLRFAHEMNGWWYPWAVSQNGNSAAGYVAAWRHVRTLFRAAGAANAMFVWSPNALTGSAQESPLEAAYPGDAYVDLVGFTGYGHGGSAAATYDATYARLAKLTTKPIMLSETGVDGTAKASWIAGFGSWLATHPRVVGFVWFATTPSTSGASGDYRYDDTATNAAAFRRALATVPLAARR